MKQRLLAALFALAGFLVAIPSYAAPAYTGGDLFLGFRATGGTGAAQDYLVNIGQLSQYSGASGSFVVSRGNIGSDLAVIFGPDWATRSDVYWSVSGANVSGDVANTLYATRARVSAGTAATPWIGRSPSTQGVANSKFNSLAYGYLDGAATQNNSFGIIQGVADPNSYASFQPGGAFNNSGGISFNLFSPTIEGTFANGVLGSVLDLFKVVPSTTDEPAANLGSFRLDSAGNLIFTPVGQVATATLRFELSNFFINEASAAGKVTLKVIRSGDLSAAVGVNLSTANGTATAGTDYTAQTLTPVSFASNQAEATVDVIVANRPGNQGDRTFTVALANTGAGATIVGPSTATVTIQEAGFVNGEIVFSSSSYSASSVDAQNNPSAIQVTLNRNGGSQGQVSIDLAVTGGTLVNGTDYDAISTPQTITFADGETSRNLTIQLSTIAASQLPGTILLGLSNPTGGAALGAENAATITVNFNNRPLVAGAYAGLLNFNNGTAPGFVSLTISANGAFTGKVTIGKYSFGVKGTFGADGRATFKPKLTASLPLSVSGKTPVNFGSFELSIDGDSLIGAVKGDANAVLATVDGTRAFFDGKTPATSVDPKYLVNKGLYTVVIPARTTQAGLAASEYPQGDGFGSLSVSKKGIVVLKGKLADGTPISLSSKLDQNYQFAVYVPLYGKLGELSGSAKLDTGAPESDLKGLNLFWSRPAIANSKYYRNGWPAGIQVDLLGASYAVPPASPAASVFPGLKPVDPVGGNATIEFTAGKLAAPVNKSVNIETNNKVSVVPATDKSLRVTISKGNGQFTGAFVHSDATKPSFQGIVYQKGPNKGGYGFFLSQPPKGGTGESGSVTLIAKP